MQNNNIHIRSLGEKAIEVSWPQKIDLKTLEAIKITSERLLKHYKDAVEDIIPAYASLLLVFSEPIDISEEIDKISSLLLKSSTPNQKSNFRWFVPVCYHPSFGWDIEDVCQAKKIEPSTLISLHSGKDYPIHFFGFLPGFFYLGGLSDQLCFKRRVSPRINVPKGSVGIGGAQTGVYPKDSPGGWQIIGRTPIDLFDVSKNPPVFAKVGDMIHFVPISIKDFKVIDANKHNYKIRREALS